MPGKSRQTANLVSTRTGIGTTTPVTNLNIVGIVTASRFVVPNTIAFFAENSSQSVTNVSTVTPTFPTVTLNQGNCWNSSSNTFTPTVPGIYVVVAQASWNDNISPLMYILKNGSVEWQSTWYGLQTYRKTNGSALIYMNGTTDYLSMSIYSDGSGTILSLKFRAALLSSF